MLENSVKLASGVHKIKKINKQNEIKKVEKSSILLGYP